MRLDAIMLSVCWIYPRKGLLQGIVACSDLGSTFPGRSMAIMPSMQYACFFERECYVGSSRSARPICSVTGSFYFERLRNVLAPLYGLTLPLQVHFWPATPAAMQCVTLSPAICTSLLASTEPPTQLQLSKQLTAAAAVRQIIYPVAMVITLHTYAVHAC